MPSGHNHFLVLLMHVRHTIPNTAFSWRLLFDLYSGNYMDSVIGASSKLTDKCIKARASWQNELFPVPQCTAEPTQCVHKFLEYVQYEYITQPQGRWFYTKQRLLSRVHHRITNLDSSTRIDTFIYTIGLLLSLQNRFYEGK